MRGWTHLTSLLLSKQEKLHSLLGFCLLYMVRQLLFAFNFVTVQLHLSLACLDKASFAVRKLQQK
jgi:hypothetical protein